MKYGRFISDNSVNLVTTEVVSLKAELEGPKIWIKIKFEQETKSGKFIYKMGCKV